MDDPQRHEGPASGRCHPVSPAPVFAAPRTLTRARSTDFENKFVCGEIMAYADLHELGSETAVKAAGKLRQQGKPYESKSLHSLISVNSADHCVQWSTAISLTGSLEHNLIGRIRLPLYIITLRRHIVTPPPLMGCL